MVRRVPGFRLPALVALGLLASAAPARAAFHLAVISEVLTSHGGSADVQAVEIEMLAGGQTFTQDSVLAVFDATGAYVADALVVPGDVPKGGAGLHWLMGTTAFETASGVQVDFEFAPALPAAGGMVCWGAPGVLPPDPGSWDHTDPEQYVDCIAYGSYAGPTNSMIGTPTSLTAEGHSLQRVSETNDNATDFACGDPTELTSNAGATAALAATTPCPALQSKGQRRCILGVNKAAAGLGVAQADEMRWCVDAFTKGKLDPALGLSPTISGCAADDLRVAKADAKIAAAESKSCDPGELPDFAFRGAAEVKAVATFTAEALLGLWSDVDTAVVTRATDDATSRCQAEAAKALSKRYQGVLKAALKAKKRVLASADTAGALSAALHAALASDPKLAKARSVLSGTVAKRCQLVPAGELVTRFAGACDSAGDALALGECVADLGLCVGCVAVEASDGLVLDCDALDGEALYGSCSL